jgi:hypothetical protein
LFALSLLPSSTRAQSNAWDVAILDQILANVQPGQTVAQVGDMFIKVSNLRAWRNQLAGGPQPLLAFDGTIQTWTTGTVFYAFSNNVSAAHQKVFLDGMNEWAMFANLHYTPRTTQSNYVLIVDDPTLSGGFSSVGMVGGQQQLHIGSTSWNRATICHEFGHTLGLIHEHQRSDRDSFVTILTNNIIPGQEANFTKLTTSANKSSYDFLSIMHYARNSFATSTNLDTIEPLPGFTQFINLMGQQFDPALSASDRAGMALVYGVPATPVTNIVTNTKDSGIGSLRGAMYYAFDHPGTTITFNIPISDPGFSNSVFTIQPTDRYLSMVNGMVIDGSTEPTNSNPNGPEIVLNGSLATLPDVFINGLRMAGTNGAVRSLVINRFNNNGIAIEGSNATGNVVAGCYIGTDPSGTTALSNGVFGVLIDAAANFNTVGGTTASARNILSGNANRGVAIRGAGTTGNVVIGNYIGLNAAGTAALPNLPAGILIDTSAASNTIGGVAAGTGNVISGNGGQGIALVNASTDGNVIQGNYIGLNAAGTSAIPNAQEGVQINTGPKFTLIGGTTAGAGNVIAGNSSVGIGIFNGGTDKNVIQGNFIGTDASGAAAVANFFSGIQISGGPKSNTIGGTVVGARNVISGNNNYGVVIFGSGTDANVVQGNYIGPSAGGSFAIPNVFSGVQISSGAKSNVVGGVTPGAGNVISGNSNYGLAIGDTNTDNTVVQGNLIGVNPAGTTPMHNTFAGVLVYRDAHFSQIGGSVPGARNIISGNLNQGIAITDPGTSATLVQGNFIGVDMTGTLAIPNSFSGVQISSGSQSNTIGGGVGTRNIISGNSNYGVLIANTNTDANIVQGDTVGLDVTGTKTIANQSGGVVIFDAARFNQVGGTTLGSANLIASNANDGVQIDDAASTNNSVRGNSIFGNTGAGITFFNGNKFRPPPALSSALLGTNLAVSGMLTSNSNVTYRIEFFANPSAPGNVQGKTFLGAINVTTGGGGTASFSAGLASTVPVGQLITATATDPTGNTSPFSTAFAVTTTDSVGDGIPDAWRAAFFSGPGNTTNSQSCAACDPDGDGLTNLQEFHAGTNPTNSSSVVRITAIQPSGADVVVSFPSVQGKIYRIEMKDDVTLATWTLLADQITGTGNLIPITDPGAASLAKRFYRALVLP